MLTNQDLHMPPKRDALRNDPGAGKGGQGNASTPDFTQRYPSAWYEQQRWQRTPHLSKIFESEELLDCHPQEMTNLPPSRFTQHSQHLPRGWGVWLNLFSQRPHPDPGEVPVPSDMASGARPSCHICREKTLSSIHIFAVTSDQPA